MTRKERLEDDLARAKERRAALDERINELEQRLTEAENAEILGMVKDADLTAAELARVMAYAKKAMPGFKKKEE